MPIVLKIIKHSRSEHLPDLAWNDITRLDVHAFLLKKTFRQDVNYNIKSVTLPIEEYASTSTVLVGVTTTIIPILIKWSVPVD